MWKRLRDATLRPQFFYSGAFTEVTNNRCMQSRQKVTEAKMVQRGIFDIDRQK